MDFFKITFDNDIDNGSNFSADHFYGLDFPSRIVKHKPKNRTVTFRSAAIIFSLVPDSEIILKGFTL